MDLNEILTGILVLIVGGILGGVGTYLVKPPLDAWLKRRKEAREAREAVRKQNEEAAKQIQLADQYAVDYRDKLVEELRNLRILDMVRPLLLERTYVRVRIQEAQPMRYADADEMTLMAQGDPNLLFELSQEKLAEDRVASLLPEEALKRNRHMVVLGDPGAGKTTMLKYLCLLSAQAKLGGLPDFPVFVPLNRFAKASQDNLLDFLVAEVTERYGFPQLSSCLQKRLEDGSVLLLLDGLDEVTVGSPEEAEAAYRRTAEGINHLVTRYPKCPIVVTSRRAGWKGLLAPTFIAASVLDFSWEDIQRFINNWFGEGSDRARRLHGVLSHQARMQALAANPLLLSLIAIVFERDLELPERRAKLYERCVQVLLTEWDAHRGIKRASQFTTDRKRDLLEDIALHYHCQGSRYFPRQDLLQVIAAYLPTVSIPAEQARLVLDEISAQHGLLKEQAADWYGFLHLTLQEYFAAFSLDQGNQLGLALTHLHSPWWEEVILLLAGMLKDATPLLDAILSEPEDIFFGNLLLAGRCLVGTPRIGRVELRGQILTGLKSLLEDEGQHWLPRTQAAKTLIEINREKGSRYLLDLLRNQALAWRVRDAVADSLGTFGSKALVSDLFAILGQGQIDRSACDCLADALIILHREPVAFRRLLKLISTREASPHLKKRFAIALGHLGDETAIPRLLELLTDASVGDYIAWYVGGSLRHLGFPTHPEELLNLLRDEDLRVVARWSLAKAVDNLEGAAAPEVVDWLIDESIEESVRCSFAYRLGRFGQAIQDQVKELYSEEALGLSLRASIGITLLHLGETQLSSELKKLLVNPDVSYYVRKKIAENLVSVGERDIAPQLVSLLQERDLPTFVRLKAADLLSGLGDSTAAPQLLLFLRDEDVEPRVRARAADALAALDLDDGLVADLRSLLTDEGVDPLVRGRAARSLVQFEQAVAWLSDLLARGDIGEEVYLALYDASRQAGIRVFSSEEGYQVLPLQPA
jgi:HEAT repeat protein